MEVTHALQFSNHRNRHVQERLAWGGKWQMVQCLDPDSQWSLSAEDKEMFCLDSLKNNLSIWGTKKICVNQNIGNGYAKMHVVQINCSIQADLRDVHLIAQRTTQRITNHCIKCTRNTTKHCFQLLNYIKLFILQSYP